MKIDFYLPA